MSFKIDDKIVCIKSENSYGLLQIGQEYTVCGFYESFSGPYYDEIYVNGSDGNRITVSWVQSRFELANKTYQVVFRENEFVTEHKMVCSDGRETGWAGYTQTTYMDGMVGVTAYYGITEGVMTADEFVQLNSVGVK